MYSMHPAHCQDICVRNTWPCHKWITTRSRLRFPKDLWQNGRNRDPSNTPENVADQDGAYATGQDIPSSQSEASTEFHLRHLVNEHHLRRWLKTAMLCTHCTDNHSWQGRELRVGKEALRVRSLIPSNTMRVRNGSSSIPFAFGTVS